MKLFENTDHSQRGHHPFGPSGTGSRDPRVGGCLGYKNRTGTSVAAAEGTASHEVLDAAVREWVKNSGTGSITDFLPRGMSDGEQSNMEFICSVIEPQLKAADEIHPELMVVLRDDNGAEINYGYLDLLTIEGHAAFLTDYKFGWTPVKSAQINRQGWNYCAAVFQAFPDLQEVTVQFLQPKLGYNTSHTFNRTQDADRLRFEIKNIIEESKRVQLQTLPEDLNPGSACEYCRHSGECKAYLSNFDLGKRKSGLLPDAVEWSAEKIETPEQAAAAMAWLNIFETSSGHIKNKCVEIAKQHGSIEGEGWSYKPATRSGTAKITNTEDLFEAFERSYNLKRHQLVSFMTISKTNAVKAAVEHLKIEDPDKTKKQLTEEIDTLLRVSGVVKVGESTTYLRKTKTP